MSLNSILSTGLSGLAASQTQLNVVSDNVANVHTPGYVRKVANQVSRVTAGVGAGVDIAGIRLATDRFLQSAALQAQADSGQSGVRDELYGRIQSLFGDPSADSSLFAQADALFSSFSVLSEDALSSPRRQEALTAVQGFLDEAARVGDGVQAVRGDADARVAADVNVVNGLLESIAALNREISRTGVAGADTSGAQTKQAQFIDQLSQYLDVKVSARAAGGVTLRTGDGVLLVSDQAGSLSYDRAGTVTAETVFNDIKVTPPGGAPVSLREHLQSGEIAGLLDLRDRSGPAAADRLAELTSRIADELNRAHNAASAVPAPTRLDGKSVGPSLASALSGFTGKTTVAIVDSSGVVKRRVDIDFGAGTFSVNGGAASGYSAAAFDADLSAALGGFGSASFANGKLSIQASGGDGVAIADDATTPSAKGGRGFSWYFGLNDLVQSTRPFVYDTGLGGTDASGFAAGQTLTFRFSSPDGARLRDITVTTPAGGSMNALLTAINDVTTGVGRYGAFALDAKGALQFTPATSPAASLSMAADSTQRTPDGLSFSRLFGVGGARGARATAFTIRSDILQDSTRLSLARFNTTATVGSRALSRSDGSGATGLSDGASRTIAFDAAGDAGASSTTISRYLADLAGDIGGRAAEAKSARESADALLQAATDRRAASEGVNLDEELVKLTTFQQSYNASARIIQAVKDMYDVLMNLT